jgi:hypothetical protein
MQLRTGAERLSGHSPEEKSFSRGVSTCDNMADNMRHGLLSTGGKEAYPTVGKTVGVDCMAKYWGSSTIKPSCCY